MGGYVGGWDGWDGCTHLCKTEVELFTGIKIGGNRKHFKTVGNGGEQEEGLGVRAALGGGLATPNTCRHAPDFGIFQIPEF